MLRIECLFIAQAKDGKIVNQRQSLIKFGVFSYILLLLVTYIRWAKYVVDKRCSGGCFLDPHLWTPEVSLEITSGTVMGSTDRPSSKSAWKFM